jgi:excisionase family DNA binding protein
VTGQPDDLLTIDEVITTLRVSRAAFYRWRRRGTGPASVRLPGGAVRFRRDALAGWLAGLQDDNKEEAPQHEYLRREGLGPQEDR